MMFCVWWFRTFAKNAHRLSDWIGPEREDTKDRDSKQRKIQ